MFSELYSHLGRAFFEWLWLWEFVFGLALADAARFGTKRVSRWALAADVARQIVASRYRRLSALPLKTSQSECHWAPATGNAASVFQSKPGG